MLKKNKWIYFLLFLVVLFSFVFRVYFSNSTYNDDEAYFHLRHIKNIVENKEVLHYDPLSFGGRVVIYPPLFHLIMAFLSFGNLFLLKYLPELFFALSIILFYFVGKELCKRDYVVLFCCLLYSFTPDFLGLTMNVLSVFSLVIPLFLLIVFCLFRLKEHRFLYIFLVSSFLFPLLHHSAMLFVVAALIFLLMNISEDLQLERIEIETLFFSILSVIFINLVLYRDLFLEYGLDLLANFGLIEGAFLFDRGIGSFLFYLGILVLFLGSFGFYIGILKKKHVVVYFLGAVFLSVLFLFIINLLSFEDSLIYLILCLCLVSCVGLDSLFNYFENFRWKYTVPFLVLTLCLLFVGLSFYPAVRLVEEIKPVALEKIEDFIWLRDYSNEGDVVLSLIDDGHLISYFSERKNVVDNNLLGAKDAQERLDDIRIIYKGWYFAKAKEYIKGYNIKWIYMPKDLLVYGISDLSYVSRTDCLVRRGNFYEV